MMTKCTALALALTMTLSLGVSAAGTTAPDQIYQSAVTTAVGYTGTITVNGKVISTRNLPAAPKGATVPLRAVAEADGGYADWFPKESLSVFGLDGNSIDVDTKTGAISINFVKTSYKATFVDGTTFVPVAVLNQLGGFKATETSGKMTVTTPNGSASAKTANSIISTVGMAASMKMSMADMESFKGLTASNFEEVVGYFPMMVRADTIIIGKVKAGKMDTVKKQLEAVRAATEAGFVNYLPEPLAMAEKGEVVTDGDYVMLIISENNDKAIELFKAAF